MLRSRKQDRAARVAVHLHARLTEIGTLDLWCSQVDSRRRWRMQFDVRAAIRTDLGGHTGLAEQEGVLDEEVWEACARAIEAIHHKAHEGIDERPCPLIEVVEIREPEVG